MTSIRILSEVTNPTKDGLQLPACPLTGCTCDVRFNFPSGSRTTLHANVDDVLTIGTIAECNAGTKDIAQSVADALIDLEWAEEI